MHLRKFVVRKVLIPRELINYNLQDTYHILLLICEVEAYLMLYFHIEFNYLGVVSGL